MKTHYKEFSYTIRGRVLCGRYTVSQTKGKYTNDSRYVTCEYCKKKLDNSAGIA